MLQSDSHKALISFLADEFAKQQDAAAKPLAEQSDAFAQFTAFVENFLKQHPVVAIELVSSKGPGVLYELQLEGSGVCTLPGRNQSGMLNPTQAVPITGQLGGSPVYR